MNKIKENKRNKNKELETGRIIWYREKIADMANVIEDEKFLIQIHTILKRHIQKRGR